MDAELDTLKAFLSEKGEDTIWTKELEAEILSYELRDETYKIGSNIELNSEVYNLFTGLKYAAYPDLYDFGSLDSSKLSESISASISEFLNSISKEPYTEKDNYFEKKYMFNYIFFLDNLKNNWKEKINKDFPTLEDYKKTEEVIEIEKDDDGNEIEKKVEKPISLDPLFTNWVFGEPFINDEIIQLPVRVYISKKYFDINLYIKNKESYPIYNIYIVKWSL